MMKLLYFDHHFLSRKISHRFAAIPVVNACVRHVRRQSVEKIQLFKSIEQAIRIFLVNVAINSIALRVGEPIRSDDI